LVMNSESTSRVLQSEDRNVCFPWFSSNSGPEGSPDKEVKKEKEEKEKNATPPILIETGQYTSIVLAAFGAIRIDVGSETAKAHPFLLLVLSLPLASVQIVSLLSLRLNLDYHVKVGMSDHPNVLAPTKLLMIILVQIMCFKYMISSLRLLVFLLNPINWLEIKRPQSKDWVPRAFQKGCIGTIMGLLSRPFLLAPWAIIGMLLRLIIGYMACVDSMSIILQCDKVQTTIFNAVGLVFVAQLTEPYWEFVASIFAMKNEHDDKWRIELDPSVWSTDAEDKIKDSDVLCKNFLECLVKWFPFLRRCHGASVMEDVAAIATIFLVYLRAIFVVAHSFKTTVLPAARDVCTLWRWQNDQARYRKLLAWSYTFFEDHLTIIPLRNRTEMLHEQWVNYHNNTDPCKPGGKYYRIQLSDYWGLLRTHPAHIGLALFVVLLVLLGKSFFSFIFLTFQRCSKEDADYEPVNEQEEDEE